MSLSNFLDAAWCVRLTETLLHFVWQGAVIALLVWGLAGMLRRASASARYAVYLGALLLMAACPVATFLVLGSPNEAAGVVSAAAPHMTEEIATGEGARGWLRGRLGDRPHEWGGVQDPPEMAGRPTRSARPVGAWHALSAVRWQRYAPYAVACYAVGVFAMLIRMLVGMGGGRRLRRESSIVEDRALLGPFWRQVQRIGVRFAPSLAYSQQVAVPTVVGVIRPMILLPVSLASGFPAEQVEMLLAHELAHIRRWDHLVNLLQRLIEAGLFFHPAVWFVSRRVRVERERCCDDVVVSAGGQPKLYAELLIRVAELAIRKRQRNPWVPRAALGAVNRSSELRGRILRLMGVDARGHARLRRGWLVAMAVAVMAGLSVVGQLGAQADAGHDKAAPEGGAASFPMTVEGYVTDGHGHRRPYAAVYLPQRLRRSRWVTADGDAKFTITGLTPAERHWIVRCGATGKMGLLILPDRRPDGVLIAPVTFDEGSIEGRVVDRNGHPVVSRTVELVVDKEGEAFGLGMVKTDEHGYYEQSVPMGDGLSLKVRLIDEDSKCSDWLLTRPLRFGQFTLDLPDIIAEDVEPGDGPAPPAGRRLYGGRVVNEAGDPIGAAEVYIEYRVDDMYRAGKRVTTGRDGRWQCRLPVDLQETLLRLFHPDYVGGWFGDGRLTPAVARLADQSAVSVMKRGLLLRGTVRDQDGRAVDDALVLSGRSMATTASGQPVEDGSMRRTDAKGRFDFRALPAGPRDLIVHARGFAPEVVPVDVQPDVEPVAIIMKPGRTLHGRVVDASGKPVDGARVSLGEWESRGDHRFARRTRTGADGRFKLRDLPSGGMFEVNYTKKGFPYHSVDGLVPQEQGYELVLYPHQTISGRAVDAATGQPITRFETWIGTASGARERPNFRSALRYRTAVEDADGRFSSTLENWIISPPNPRFCVRIVADGYYQAQTPLIAPGETLDSVEVRLERANPLTGRVLDASGRPVGKAKVAWVGPGLTAFVKDGQFERQFVGSPEYIVATDSDGRFTLPPSNDAGHILVLSESGYADVASHDLANDSTIRVTAWSRIEGRLLQGSQPQHGQQVVMDSLDSNQYGSRNHVNWWFTQSTHIDGSFGFDHVPAIALRVGRSTAMGVSHPVAVTPRPGKTHDVTLGGAGCTVSGRLVKPDGVSIPAFDAEYGPHKHFVHVVAHDGSRPAAAPVARVGFIGQVQPDGRFVVHDVPEGAYTLDVTVHAPPMPNTCGWPLAIASATTPLAISPDSKTVDLGDVALVTPARSGVNQAAPPLAGQTLAGDKIDLAAFRGTLVLLDFWATWCGPCLAIEGQLTGLCKKYRATGQVAFVGINCDFDTDKAAHHAKSHGLSWPHYAAKGWGQDSEVLRAFGVTSIPSLWLIAPNGTILARDIEPERLEPTLKQAVADAFGHP